jgi:gliding motility-associated-like protein
VIFTPSISLVRQLIIILINSLLFGSSSFSQAYFLNGNAASLGGDCYEVTPAINWQTGAIWYANQIDLTQPFDIQFELSFTNNDNGADGIVFVLQTVSNTAMGTAGGGMGFSGFDPSFGIQFDIHPNNAQVDPANDLLDPSYDHIAYMRDGSVNHSTSDNLAGPVQMSSTAVNVEDGIDHHVRITWNPSTSIVTTYFDCVQRISTPVNLTSILGANSAFWGFTGSTGGLNSQQRVCLSPTIFDPPQTVNACPGEPITLNGMASPVNTYNWSPSTGLDNAAIQSPTLSVASAQTFTLTYYGFCNTPHTVDYTIVVATPPTISAGNDSSICAGSTLQLQGSSTTTNIQWTGTGTISSGATSTTPIVNAGTYELTANYGTSCSISDEVVIAEIPLPIIELGNNLTPCPGENVTLNAGSGWDNVLWSTLETTSTISVSADNIYTVTVEQYGCSASDNITVTHVILPTIDLGSDIAACASAPPTLDAGIVVTWNDNTVGQTHAAASTGAYTATYTNQGCTASDQIYVQIDPAISIDLGEDTHICEGDSLMLDAGINGTWSTSAVGPTLWISAAGSYFVDATQGLCSATDTITVSLDLLPSGTLGDDILVCLDKVVTLTFSSENALSYLWSTGEMGSSIETKAAGTFSITAFNSCGSFQDSITVTREECNAFVYVPSAFTPNGDDLDEVWRPSTFNVKNYEVTVFNRWGQPIFHSKDPDQYWIGDCNGNGFYVEDGVFAFLITYSASDIELVSKSGTVTIIR